jgi:hypothetical protein
LVIPVGQTWPWLPADQTNLRGALVETGDEPLLVTKSSRFLGLADTYVLHRRLGRRPLVRVHPSRSGYEWEADGASWALRRVGGLSGRTVLTRNGQPLAAIQYQGRLLNTWSEMIYDGRGYRLSHVRGQPGCCVLADEANDEALRAVAGAPMRVELRRALPLPLLVMAIVRILDEAASTAESSGPSELGAETEKRQP